MQNVLGIFFPNYMGFAKRINILKCSEKGRLEMAFISIVVHFDELRLRLFKADRTVAMTFIFRLTIGEEFRDKGVDDCKDSLSTNAFAK